MRFRRLKQLLRRFDIVAFKRSTGIYLPEDEMPQLVARLCTGDSPIVVDGGAHRGDFVHALRQQLPSARFLCFEPDPDLVADLERTFAGDASVRIVAAALGREAGTARLHLNQGRATNSLMPGTPQTTGVLRELMVTERVADVRVTTLDDALAASGLERADVIKLDLQGYDYFALQGATAALRGAQVVVTEVWFAPTYEGAADYLDVCTLMRERGYGLYALTSLHYAGTDRLLWGDAVFVPHGSPAWRAPFTH